MDDHSPAPARPAKPGRAFAWQLAAVVLVVVSAVAGTGLARLLRAPRADEQPRKKEVTFPAGAFKGWKRPDFVLVLSGQMHGYLLPCGCSRPQVGGLERRYNFLQLVKAAEWPVLALDLGDVAQRSGPANLPNVQGPIKYGFALRALAAMNYTAVGLGESEAGLGLGHLLDTYVFDQKVPHVITSNLMDAEKNFPTMTKPWVMSEVEPAGVRVGVGHVVGLTARAKIKQAAANDDKARFSDAGPTLDSLVKQMKEKKIDLPVLLYQGPVTRDPQEEEKTEALAVAAQYPHFPLVVCFGEDDEAASRPIEVKHAGGGKSLVLSMGRKGKHLGVVGVWKTGKDKEPFEFRYERIELSEDYLTAKGEGKDHPIVKLMDEYTRELKAQDYLSKYKPVRHELQTMPEVEVLFGSPEAKFVGSAKCKKCHEEAYKVWKDSAHSHAYQTLVDATGPANRQFDPECIVCHTVGFNYVSGFTSEKATPELKDVGCESCHGPGSVHVANSKNKEWQRRLNPWKYIDDAKKRAFATDQFCQRCHDLDNDVNWKNGAFEKKWKLIAHPTPAKK